MNTEDWIEKPALESVSNDQALAALNEGHQRALQAVAAIHEKVSRAVDATTERLSRGGRLIFCGAGASIRIAVQDGVELKPTYGWPDDRLVYLVAGGDQALLQSVEGAEDDANAAKQSIKALKLTDADVVIGVAASGRTPFTVAAIEAARLTGALTIGVANNRDSALLSAADIPLPLVTGPEVIAGSTRMAAGTAQKVCLNQFTTLVMVRLNKTYQNLMVDMDARNEKLNGRRIVMLQRIFPDMSTDLATQWLDASHGQVKLAAASYFLGSVSAGRNALAAVDGCLAKVLNTP